LPPRPGTDQLIELFHEALGEPHGILVKWQSSLAEASVMKELLDLRASDETFAPLRFRAGEPGHVFIYRRKT